MSTLNLKNIKVKNARIVVWFPADDKIGAERFSSW